MWFMKATGMIRKVDELGRVVVPKELRKKFDITDNVDSFEIFVENDSIILKKYQPSCIFCGETEGITVFKNKNVCCDCIKKISESL